MKILYIAIIFFLITKAKSQFQPVGQWNKHQKVDNSQFFQFLPGSSGPFSFDIQDQIIFLQMKDHQQRRTIFIEINRILTPKTQKGNQQYFLDHSVRAVLSKKNGKQKVLTFNASVTLSQSLQTKIENSEGRFVMVFRQKFLEQLKTQQALKNCEIASNGIVWWIYLSAILLFIHAYKYTSRVREQQQRQQVKMNLYSNDFFIIQMFLICMENGYTLGMAMYMFCGIMHFSLKFPRQKLLGNIVVLAYPITWILSILQLIGSNTILFLMVISTILTFYELPIDRHDQKCRYAYTQTINLFLLIPFVTLNYMEVLLPFSPYCYLILFNMLILVLASTCRRGLKICGKKCLHYLKQKCFDKRILVCIECYDEINKQDQEGEQKLLAINAICGHWFHLKCYEEAEKKGYCPQDRKKIKEEERNEDFE